MGSKIKNSNLINDTEIDSKLRRYLKHLGLTAAIAGVTACAVKEAGASTVIADTFKGDLLNHTNPEYYGAVGDGITDDTDAFTAMFAAIISGTRIELTAEKTYLVGNGFTLSDINNLIWIGNHATIKSKTGLTTDYFLTITNGDNINFEETVYDMQNAETVGQRLSALRFIGTTKNTNILDNDFSNSGYGVIFGGTHDEIRIDGNRMIGKNDYSVENVANSVLDLDLVYFAGIAITNVVVANNYGDQIWSLVLGNSSVSQIEVANNLVFNTHDSSIYLRSNDAYIHHNRVIDAGKDSIKCFDEVTPSRCRIENNYLSGVGVHKVDGGYHIINFTNDGRVVDNEILIPTLVGKAVSIQTGVIVEGSNIVVSNNKIKGTDPAEASHGISLKSSAKNNSNILIIDNTIDTLSRGVNFGGNETYTIDGLYIKNNHFKNTNYGIVAYSSGITPTQIDNIYVDSNIFDAWVVNEAIYFETANKVSILNNKFLSGTGLTAINLNNISHAVVDSNKSDGTETTFISSSGTTYDLKRNNYKGSVPQESSDINGILGDELVTIDDTCLGWVLGDGWICNGDGTISKNGDGLGTASFDTGEVAGTQVYFSYTIEDIVGTITMSIGGIQDIPRTTNGTFTGYIVLEGTNNLTFTPTLTTSRAKISAISVKTNTVVDFNVDGKITTRQQLQVPFTINSALYSSIAPIGYPTKGFSFLKGNPGLIYTDPQSSSVDIGFAYYYIAIYDNDARFYFNTDTSIYRNGAGILKTDGSIQIGGSLTVTGKTIPRISTITSSATPTPPGDTADIYTITALAEAATFAAPTGTPVEGQKLLIRIKDNGTARDLAWNAIYRAGTDIALPTTTVISKTMYCEFIYNNTDSKWDLIRVVNNI